MTCPQTQPLLDAYADHALNIWQAYCVCRHLARCAACTTQLADIQRLSAAVRVWQDVPAPPGLSAQIAAALPPPAAVPTPPRNRRTARRTALSLAGIAAAIGVGFWLVPGQPGRPTVAFADVQRAMQQAQVISFTTLTGSADAAGDNFKPFAPGFVTWVKRNPPAIAATDATGKSLEDARGAFTHSTKGRYSIGKIDHKDLAKQVKGAFQLFTQEALDQPFDHGYDYEVVTKPQQCRVNLNGKQRILFTYNADTVFRRSKSTPGKHNRSRCSVWVDPKTRLVVRREIFYWQQKEDSRTPSYRMVVDDDFRYNQAPPLGVFDWSPPKGAKTAKF